MIGLLIVEDNEIVRNGLVRFLSEDPNIHIAGEAENGAHAIKQLIASTAVDVVLVDWNMPDMDGLTLTRLLTVQCPKIKVIILTMHSNPDYKAKAKMAGAKGYVLKDVDMEKLIEAIKAVAGGREVFM
ncbi:response regulator [Pedobacter terrae]|uniref:response regulator n=1 Tax=Pedobacter terrae TaxID=405671 RepID=UPI002FF819ED